MRFRIASTFSASLAKLRVACTRARDRLLVTGVDPGSEFLDDLVQAG